MTSTIDNNNHKASSSSKTKTENDSSSSTAKKTAAAPNIEGLFPLERIFVSCLMFIGKLCLSTVFFIFGLAITHWSRTKKKSLGEQQQEEEKQHRDEEEHQQAISSAKRRKSPPSSLMTRTHHNHHLHGPSSSLSQSPSTLSKTSSSSSYHQQKQQRKMMMSDDEKNAICMANMLATGVLPYYLASECTNAMKKPKSPDATPKSKGTTTSTTAKNVSFITRIVADGSAKFRVLLDPRDQEKHKNNNNNNKNNNNTSNSGGGSSSNNQHSNKKKNKIDGIILVVGSSAQSDDVNRNCDAPVLGSIAQQLADSCTVVGSLVVVSARIDFLTKPESLSVAVERFEKLCTAVCSEFPTAKGPLIIIARHVTATLALHAVERASKQETTTSHQYITNKASDVSSPNSNNNNNNTGVGGNPFVTTATPTAGAADTTPHTAIYRSAATDNDTTDTDTDNSNNGLFPVPEREPPSLRNASLLVFSPFVGWKVDEAPSLHNNNNSSSLNHSTSSSSSVAAAPLSAMRTPQGGSSQNLLLDDYDDEDDDDQQQNITPQHSPMSKHYANNNNDNQHPYHHYQGFTGAEGDEFGGGVNLEDEDDMFFDKFEENGSFLTGGGWSSIPKSAQLIGDDGEVLLDDDAILMMKRNGSNSNGVVGLYSKIWSFFSSASTIIPSLLSNVKDTIVFLTKNATRPQKWKLSRLFKWRIRSVGSQLWTRMQEEVAPKMFSPCLREWFPASSITFLHPSIKALVVCDSAAPYSVETLHWARNLVSQGCQIRLVEWSSQSSKVDPYSEFVASVIDNEATAWLRDLLVESISGRSNFSHHHHTSFDHHHQQQQQNMLLPEAWNNQNFTLHLAHQEQGCVTGQENFTRSNGNTPFLCENVESVHGDGNDDDEDCESYYALASQHSRYNKEDQQRVHHQQRNVARNPINNSNNNSMKRNLATRRNNSSNQSKTTTNVNVSNFFYMFGSDDHQQQNNNNNNNNNTMMSVSKSADNLVIRAKSPNSSEGTLPTPPFARRETAPPHHPTTAPSGNRPQFPSGPSISSSSTTATHHHNNLFPVGVTSGDTSSLMMNSPSSNNTNNSNNTTNSKQQVRVLYNSENLEPIQRQHTLIPGDNENDDDDQLERNRSNNSFNSEGGEVAGNMSSNNNNSETQQHSNSDKATQNNNNQDHQQRQQQDNNNADEQQQQQQRPRLRHVDSCDRWSMHASEFSFK